MGEVIDNRVVGLDFEGKKFESGVQSSLKSIADLKKGLNFDESIKSLDRLSQTGKSFSLAGIGTGVDTIASRFSALGAIGFTVLQNLTNAAINLGKQILNSIVDPAKKGFAEYEIQMNAIQTVLANTASKGTTLEDVNKALAELNTYADKTIYNFSEMTRNIGTFTAAGLSLETSTAAIKGIANLAAVSGSNSQQASTAMYQLSQALSSGTLKLMDWNSVVNAGMGGQVFQDALKETARLHGVKIDDMIKKEGSFRETLKNGWATTAILTETLAKFTGDLTADQLKAIGYTEEQITGILKLGQVANDAATKVKTLSQLKETLKEALQSGWAQTWQIIVGDFNEAKGFFTSISDVLGGIIVKSADSRNKLLQGWKDFGGRETLLKGLWNIFNSLQNIITAVSNAFSKFFPPKTSGELMRFTVLFEQFSSKIASIPFGTIEKLVAPLKGVFAILGLIPWAIGEVTKGFLSLFKGTTFDMERFSNATQNIGDFLENLRSKVIQSDFIKKFFAGIPEFVGKARKAFDEFATKVEEKFGIVKKFVLSVRDAFIDFHNKVSPSITNVKDLITNFFASLDFSGVEIFFGKLSTRFEIFKKLGEFLSEASKKLKDVMKRFAPLFDGFRTMVINFVNKLGVAIMDGINKLDFSTLFDFINGSLIISLILAIKNFVTKGSKSLDGVSGIFKDASGIFKRISSIFDGVRGSLEAWQKSLQAKTLLTIASAIGIITISLIALSMVDSVKLTIALGAITAMFADLVASMAVFSKVSGTGLGITSASGSLIAMSIGILILSKAVIDLSKIKSEDLNKGLLTITELALVLVIFSRSLSTNSVNIFQGAAALLLFSVSLSILISAVKQLGAIDPVELTNGLIGVGVLMAELAIFMKTSNLDQMGGIKAVGIIALSASILLLSIAVSKFGSMDVGQLQQGLVTMGLVLAELAMFLKIAGNGTNLIETAIGVTILGGAMFIFSEALSKLGNMSWDELVRGLVGMAAALTIVTVAIRAMPKDAILVGVTLVIISGALIILSKALKKMGSMSWNEIGRGLTVLAASLTILAIGMYAMQGALPGAAALLLISAALTLFIPVLITLGSMTFSTIVVGLLAIAGVFLIFGVAGYLLAPVVPVLLGLAGAIALLGLAALAMGAGVLAFSAGLAALAVTGVAGATALVAIVSIILGLAPIFIKTLVSSIVLFATLIGDAAPVIGDALKKTLLSLIDVINSVIPPLLETLYNLLTQLIELIRKVVPQFIDAVLELIGKLLTSIAEKMPEFIQAGFDILLAFLRGIRDNIAEVATLAIEIVINFIDAVAKKLPDVIDSGWNLIISFIDGIANSIEQNSGRLTASVDRLGTAIVDGIVNGLKSKFQDAVSAASELGQAIIDAIMAKLKIKSPSEITDDLGQLTTKGLVLGLSRNINKVSDASSELGKEAISGISNAVSKIGNFLDENMDLAPSIRPVVDLRDVISSSKSIDDLLSNSVNIGAAGNIASIVSGMSKINSDKINPGEKQVATVSLTQINNSPVPLSPIEIYRQTRNQLLTVRGFLI